MFEIALIAGLVLPGKPEPVLTFATYNVCKTSCGSGQFTWDRRKNATVRTILSARPDVLGLQEADNSFRFYKQKLKKHGYSRMSPDRNGCRGRCVPDSQLFYRTSAVIPLGSASQSLAAWGPTALSRSVQDRNLTWGLFRDRASGGAFIAVSLHLPNEKSAKAERYRKHLAGIITPRLKTWRQKVGAPSVPVVLMGDLNSFARRQPRGAQWILGRQGFLDTYSAPRKTNGKVTTVNTSATARNPFPPGPRRSDRPTRIDYVMVNNGRALRYEVHIRLKGGRFDNRYRGSDHNLVKATVKLPWVGLPDPFTDG
jgi:endonuclease/exonuclease/phosphatase family metal-dependent hydrolase